MRIGDEILDLEDPWSTEAVLDYVVGRGLRKRLICDKEPENRMDLKVNYKTTEELSALGVSLEDQNELAKLMLLEVAACLLVCGHGLDICFARQCFDQLLDAWRGESEESFLAAFQPLVKKQTRQERILRDQVIRLRNHQALENCDAHV